jgi:hypothetical protein
VAFAVLAMLALRAVPAATGWQPPAGAYGIEPDGTFVETPGGRAERVANAEPGPSRWCVDGAGHAWPRYPAAVGLAPDERWQRLDATHWLRTVIRRPPAGLPPGPAGPAFARAWEPDIAALQQRIRTGTAIQAADARRELVTLRERVGVPLAPGMPRPAPPRLEVRERWTRLGSRCPAEPSP